MSDLTVYLWQWPAEASFLADPALRLLHTCLSHVAAT